jgi:hypothetical protein
MRVDEFLQTLESQLQAWTAGLWRGESLPRLREEAARLEREVRQRTEVLERHYRGLEGLRQRVAAAEGRASLLTEWVQTYLRVADRATAWHYALELDHLRRDLAQDRSRLEVSERIYRDSAADLEGARKRLAEVRRRVELHPG